MQKVGIAQFTLMTKQKAGMTSYLEALEDRMRDMGIDADYVVDQSKWL